MGPGVSKTGAGCWTRPRSRRRPRTGTGWESERGEPVGTVTIVCDYGRPERTHLLAELQHHFQGAVVCTTHVHLDHRNCLEAIVLKGKGPHVQTIADRLISAKGARAWQAGLHHDGGEPGLSSGYHAVFFAHGVPRI